VLDLDKRELKKLRVCPLYRLGELLVRKVRQVAHIGLGVPSVVSISVPVPYWSEEKLVLYAHREERGGKSWVEIFSLPRNIVLKMPLDDP